MTIDDLIGAVFKSSEWRFFWGPPADWTLDYKKYNPQLCEFYRSNPQNWGFRNGLVQVDERNADDFIQYLGEREISLDTMIANKHLRDEYLPRIVVDFDNRVFFNYFFDLELEDYAPSHWQSDFRDPLEYLPAQIASQLSS